MQHPFLEQKEDAGEDDHRSAAAPSSAGDGAPPHSRIHRSRPSMAESHNHGHPTATVPDELRCTYRSKPCPNERARKRNGTFHKLCQEHRLRANENQRNMQRRLRERRRQELDQAERRSLDDSAPLDEDADVAELYRMGLLYDDEQDRGEGFDLNSIDHQEPVYSIRPAKRSRRNKARGWDDLDQLHLNLSFTDLGGDQTIAQFLSSTDSDPSDDGSLQPSSTRTSRIFAPLRVIYELDGSQPDIDVDTSQPPDLITDILSDYDCFSDSDLDDLPSQREVRDSAAAPASDAWVVLGDDS